jgi:hypothetical protein
MSYIDRPSFVITAAWVAELDGVPQHITNVLFSIQATSCIAALDVPYLTSQHMRPPHYVWAYSFPRLLDLIWAEILFG